MNSSLKETLRRLAEMTAELNREQDQAQREGWQLDFRDMDVNWRREFMMLLKINKDFWWKMAELENICSMLYMVDDLKGVQSVCGAMDELEATGKHNYFSHAEGE